MNDDLVSRDWLKEDVRSGGAPVMGYLVMDWLDSAPSANKHGRWEDFSPRAEEEYRRCSICKTIKWKPSGKYCSECGARMDKEKIDYEARFLGKPY